MRVRPDKLITGSTIGVVAAFTLIWPWLCWGDLSAFRENGSIEGCQSIYLILAVAFLLWAARTPTPLSHVSLSGIALFTFNLFIRETDVRGTWAEPLLGGLFLHGRAFFYLAGLWTTLIAMVCLRVRSTAMDLWTWLRGPAGAAMAVGCLLYIGGHIAEKHGLVRDRDRSEELEETLELFACFSILVSGWVTMRRPDRGARP